jgi:hypothetical protein
MDGRGKDLLSHDDRMVDSFFVWLPEQDREWRWTQARARKGTFVLMTRYQHYFGSRKTSDPSIVIIYSYPAIWPIFERISSSILKLSKKPQEGSFLSLKGVFYGRKKESAIT